MILEAYDRRPIFEIEFYSTESTGLVVVGVYHHELRSRPWSGLTRTQVFPMISLQVMHHEKIIL